jgi:hypothetical protein
MVSKPREEDAAGEQGYLEGLDVDVDAILVPCVRSDSPGNDGREYSVEVEQGKHRSVARQYKNSWERGVRRRRLQHTARNQDPEERPGGVEMSESGVFVGWNGPRKSCAYGWNTTPSPEKKPPLDMSMEFQVLVLNWITAAKCYWSDLRRPPFPRSKIEKRAKG